MRTPETYEATMAAFDKHVGLRFLRAFHVNDSKAELGSHRDLHENIGMGHLTIDAFRLLMSDPRHDGLPFILETPLHDDSDLLEKGDSGIGDVWQKEIELLYQLEAGTDTERVKELVNDIRVIREAVEKKKKKKKTKIEARALKLQESQIPENTESSELSEVDT
jgi:AP endonuclease-1